MKVALNLHADPNDESIACDGPSTAHSSLCRAVSTTKRQVCCCALHDSLLQSASATLAARWQPACKLAQGREVCPYRGRGPRCAPVKVLPRCLDFVSATEAPLVRQERASTHWCSLCNNVPRLESLRDSCKSTTQNAQKVSVAFQLNVGMLSTRRDKRRLLWPPQENSRETSREQCASPQSRRHRVCHDVKRFTTIRAAETGGHKRV